MGRSLRVTEPGLAYHVLNRRVMRLPLFEKDEDYLAFERVLAEALDRPDTPRLLAWSLMPNHWHLVLYADDATNLSTWMQWVTVTHTHRWHAYTRTAGEGPLYQGRFKSFPVQHEGHFLTLCRYVEANAYRAKLVRRAEDWRWCSLWVRRGGKSELRPWKRPWPVDRPNNWLTHVNRPLDEPELQSVRQSLARGTPFGAKRWTARIASRLGLQKTLRPRGRPRKEKLNDS
jgi:putative transposase